MADHELYVANTSLQTHILLFQLKPGGKVYEQNIPIGSQVLVLNKRITDEETKHFIEKKERYGFRNVRDLNDEKGFVGICYSVDAPVKIDSIMKNLEHSDGVLKDNQETRLQESTVAIAKMLSDAVSAPTPLTRAAVETVEETSGTPRVAAGAEFTAEGVEPRNRGKRAKRPR